MYTGLALYNLTTDCGSTPIRVLVMEIVGRGHENLRTNVDQLSLRPNNKHEWSTNFHGMYHVGRGTNLYFIL